MITLRRVVEPVTISCPHCDAPMLIVEEHRDRLLQEGGHLFDDGDTIQGVHDSLPLGQLLPCTFHDVLEVGHRPCCGRHYFFVEVMVVLGDPDEDFRDTFFFLNGDRGKPTNFMATRGKRDWWVQRFESPLGPVLHHYIGPLKLMDDSILGDNGVMSCSSLGSETWALARRIVVEMWDDLRMLSYGGLETGGAA